jgi:hypothetical protein
MRFRTSTLTFGRPPRGRDRHRQYRRKPARCQPTTVSGFTIAKTLDQLGHRCRKAVQKNRSQRFKAGRGRLRLSTATCCRKSEDFQGNLHATAEENTDSGEQCEDQGSTANRCTTPSQLLPLAVDPEVQSVDSNTSQSFEYIQLAAGVWKLLGDDNLFPRVSELAAHLVDYVDLAGVLTRSQILKR